MIEHIDINMLVAFTFVAGIGGTIWCLASDLLRAWQAWRHRRKLRSQVRRHFRDSCHRCARRRREAPVSESRFPYAPSG
jgi:hypothetical protein